MKHYDIIIIGAGPGGIFSAYELATKRPDLKSLYLKLEIVLRKESAQLTASA